MYGTWTLSPLGDESDPSDTVNLKELDQCEVHHAPTMDGFDYIDNDWRCCDAC